MDTSKIPNMRSAKVVEVIQIETLEGTGESLQNLCRLVTWYYSKDGKLLAYRDVAKDDKRDFSELINK